MKFTVPVALNCAMASAVICILCFCAAFAAGQFESHTRAIICMLAPFPGFAGLLLCKVGASVKENIESGCETITAISIFNAIAAISCLLVILFFNVY